jgi:hypothetical protein
MLKTYWLINGYLKINNKNQKQTSQRKRAAPVALPVFRMGMGAIIPDGQALVLGAAF